MDLWAERQATMNDNLNFYIGEKEEILMDALDKTIGNYSMEYDLGYASILGCLEILKAETIKKYKEGYE